jgi:hypothetical protein
MNVSACNGQKFRPDIDTMSGVVLDTNQSLIQPLYKQFISAKAARD